MNTDAASMQKIKKPKISQFKIIFTYSYYNVFVYYNKPLRVGCGGMGGFKEWADGRV